jgi:hypothetical protein
MHLRELWGQRIGLAIAVLLAALAASRFLFGFSLIPPATHDSSVGLASASTRVLVDTPRSSVIDLRQDTYSFTSLTNRALLLGNVMASLPVRNYISRRSGIPAAAIKVAPPITPEQPRALSDAASQPKTGDLLKSPEEYRLSVQANPTVPMLDVYAEAPDGPTAARLANGAVDGLRDYLSALAAEHATPLRDRLRLDQLGRARGATIDSGAKTEIAVLVFLLVFAVASAAVLFVARVRRGWRASATLHRTGSAG